MGHPESSCSTSHSDCDLEEMESMSLPLTRWHPKSSILCALRRWNKPPLKSVPFPAMRSTTQLLPASQENLCFYHATPDSTRRPLHQGSFEGPLCQFFGRYLN